MGRMLVKICGLTNPEEAVYLNRNQVDYAGIVLFYEKSRRNNTVQNAKKILSALDRSIQTVAVVVSPSKEEVKQVEEAGFDYIQIHGIVSEELLGSISIPVFKAFNVTDIGQYENYRGCTKIAGYIFDAAEPGSGRTFDWNLVKRIPRDGKLFLLAGGLTPENVAEAALAASVDGVDVSTGVEYSGKSGKDPEKIDLFVKRAREGCEIDES